MTTAFFYVKQKLRKVTSVYVILWEKCSKDDHSCYSSRVCALDIDLMMQGKWRAECLMRISVFPSRKIQMRWERVIWIITLTCKLWELGHSTHFFFYYKLLSKQTLEEAKTRTNSKVKQRFSLIFRDKKIFKIFKKIFFICPNKIIASNYFKDSKAKLQKNSVVHWFTDFWKYFISVWIKILPLLISFLLIISFKKSALRHYWWRYWQTKYFSIITTCIMHYWWYGQPHCHNQK